MMGRQLEQMARKPRMRNAAAASSAKKARRGRNEVANANGTSNTMHTAKINTSDKAAAAGDSGGPRRTSRLGSNKPSQTDSSSESSDPKSSKDFGASGRVVKRVHPQDRAQSQIGPLIAELRGKRAAVRVILDNVPLDRSMHEDSERSMSTPGLGHDGNQYYCHVCGLFGDVVCCDSCPRVFHQSCIPLDNDSRKALDNDVDPWYCPECLKANRELKPREQIGASSSSSTPATTLLSRGRSDKNDRKSSQHRCVDCEGTGGHMEPCEDCGNYVHEPSCVADDDEVIDSTTKKKRVLCSTCRAVDALADEQFEEYENKDKDEDVDDGADDDGDDGEDGDRVRQKKRRRKGQDADRKPKKKKRRRASLEYPSHQIASPFQLPAPRQKVIDPDTGLVMPQSTPAFFYFLTENRWKIERALQRKHRYFNRLPKGDDRNVLVTKEAATWWVKLRPADHRRYINMSMREFETKVVEWKEEKTLFDMAMQSETGDGMSMAGTDHEDDRKQSENDQLRAPTMSSVGSKSFSAEPEQKYNHVLWDMLQDHRFHPLPLITAEDRPLEDRRIESECITKISLPHFEVHGPVSTSIGDECLGCLRGWAHFCNVVQRRLPALEVRDKLQPPMSALLATRVGLGLRPRLERDDDEIDVDSQIEKLKLFESVEVGVTRDIKHLSLWREATLNNANERADDLAIFLEGATMMKSMERETSTWADRAQHQKRFKCCRCLDIISSRHGCVSCRRAQHILNVAKKKEISGKEGSEAKVLHVQALMLARGQNRDWPAERQKTAAARVSDKLVQEHWIQYTILPQSRLKIPRPSTQAYTALQQQELGHEVIGATDSIIYDNSETGDSKSSSAASPYGANLDDADDLASSARLIAAAAMTGLRRTSNMPNEDKESRLACKDAEAAALEQEIVHLFCHSALLAMLRRDPLKLVITERKHDIITGAAVNSDLPDIKANTAREEYASLSTFFDDVHRRCDTLSSHFSTASEQCRTASKIRQLCENMQPQLDSWANVALSAYDDWASRSLHLFAFQETRMLHDLLKCGAFESLRQDSPVVYEMLQRKDWLCQQIQSDLDRTYENEASVLGALAIRRAAVAAEASLASSIDSTGDFNLVGRRLHYEDQSLADRINAVVNNITAPPDLSDVPTWRDISVVDTLRKIQDRRVQKRVSWNSGCSRCGPVIFDKTRKEAMQVGQANAPGCKLRSDPPRIEDSRRALSTGLGSDSGQDAFNLHQDSMDDKKLVEACKFANVSIRFSSIAGLGLFANQSFRKGDVVAESDGETLDCEELPAIAAPKGLLRVKSARAGAYHKKDGVVRFINHCCAPNCVAQSSPNDRNALIIALRDIAIDEEMTCDYQSPLSESLDSRVVCTCHADHCRGFINWAQPENDVIRRDSLGRHVAASVGNRMRRLEKHKISKH